ncbi:uncharacterized protein LOC132293137 [Cornus florida]|uniref:uncharacterized protein LOC132293137 n=1 Tax=Cornus florida TaxID=4283 RepID=UPI0028A088F7|nr:uncharacterized protein LOC132293137 [Cornus florida]
MICLMKYMEHTYFLRLLVLFLGFSFVLYSVAIPTSRSVKPIKEEVSVQDLLAQDIMDLRIDGEILEERLIKGRMDMEKKETDYPGTEASNNHDPKAPGTA